MITIEYNATTFRESLFSAMSCCVRIDMEPLRKWVRTERSVETKMEEVKMFKMNGQSSGHASDGQVRRSNNVVNVQFVD